MARPTSLLQLPKELVQRITKRLPTPARVEFHLLCKKLYSDLELTVPKLSSLKGHAHAMLLLLCNRNSLQPEPEVFGWPVFLEIETRYPSQIVKIVRQSSGVLCVYKQASDSLVFLTEEEVYRKLVFCNDIVHRVTLVVGQDKCLPFTELQHIAYFMSLVLKQLPVKYSGELAVYTDTGCKDVVLRKVNFLAEAYYFDSRRRVDQSPTKQAMPDLYSSLPSSTCALSLVVKEDMYTPYL